MSTLTDEKIIQTYTLGAKMPRMPKSRIPELMEKAFANGLSFRDIRRRSGDQIPLSTLNLLHKNKTNPNLTMETIMALARGLGESPTVVFDAAIGKSSNGLQDESFRQLFDDISRLSASDREELRVFLDALKGEVQKRLDRDA